MSRRKQTHPSRHSSTTTTATTVNQTTTPCRRLNAAVDNCYRITPTPILEVASTPITGKDNTDDGTITAALDLSVKRIRPNAPPPPVASSSFSVNQLLSPSRRTPIVAAQPPLQQLSSLVTRVGNGATTSSSVAIVENTPILPTTTATTTAATTSTNAMQELWSKYMKKEESAELRRINEAKQIFTCLQCRASFESLDELVKHMERTQHFTNVPKHYSWSLQYARQKMRHMKLLKVADGKCRSLLLCCYICGQSVADLQHHLAIEHGKLADTTTTTSCSSRNTTADSSCSESGGRSGSESPSSDLCKMEQLINMWSHSNSS